MGKISNQIKLQDLILFSINYICAKQKIMKQFKLLIILTLAAFINLNAQGTINVMADAPIDEMMTKYTSINQSKSMINGYRIQLLATTDRRKVEAALGRFRSLYPTIPADWQHSPPYYKLRAGAYETKLDALRQLELVKADYPSAYPAQAKINLRALVY